MKRIAFLFICFLQVQFVFTQEFNFNTQEEIDSFQMNNPGLYECQGVWIWGDDITNLEGLSSLTTITESLYIDNCDNLENLTGLENLSYVGITEQLAYGLYIADNDRLKNLNGLNGLTTINGRLGIFAHDSLEGVSGLENLTIVGDGLFIEGNSSLDNLDGLSSLTTVGMDGIQIFINPQLTNINGIENIDGGSVEYLLIKYNESLSHCHVQSICDYLVSPNGSTNIANNSTGCNSPEEVVEACLTGVNEPKKANESLVVNPNPTKNKLKVESEKFKVKGKKYIHIYHSQGLKVEEIKVPDGNESMEIDVFKYTDGLYFLQYIHSNQIVETVKFIKK